MKSKLTVLSFGAGQDSTDILYDYIYDPDFRAKYAPNDFLVLMSDTGDEHASTYKHVLYVQELCRKHGIEFVFITEDMGYHGSWGNLRSFYRRTNTVGSKAYPKTCTDKLKLVPIYDYLEDWLVQKYPELGLKDSTRKQIYNAFAEKYGKIDVLLGIAKGEEKRLADPAKAAKLPKWQQNAINKVYPLIENGKDRKACQESIKAHGHIVPTPSNCVLCPWMNEIELVHLYRFHRTDYEEWVQIEANKIQANLHMGEKNLGVWGKTDLLPEKLAEAMEKHGHMSDEELKEYKMSHGHCVASKY